MDFNNVFEPGCNIDSRPKQVAVPLQHISKVDAYTRPQLRTNALLGHALESQCAIDSLNRARKLCKDAVTSRVGNPALVQFDLMLSYISDFSKSSESSCLVQLHEF